MAKHLYTIVCEYAGGTYVAQIEAADEQAALYDWIKGRLDDGLPFSKRSYRSIRKKIDGNELSAVLFDQLKNAWCASFTQGETYVSVTLVRTAR